MKITQEKLIKEIYGSQGSSLLVGGIKSAAIYAHTLTAGGDTESRTEVARDRMTPSHAGDKATSQE